MKIGEEFELVYIYTIGELSDNFLISYSNKPINIKDFPNTHEFPYENAREAGKVEIEDLSNKAFFWQKYGESFETSIDGKVVNIFSVDRINETKYQVVYSEDKLKNIYKKGNENLLLESPCPLANQIENQCTAFGFSSRSRKSKSRKFRSRKSRSRKSRPRKRR